MMPACTLTMVSNLLYVVTGNKLKPSLFREKSGITHLSLWRTWDWRSEGDLMMNGTFFTESGKEAVIFSRQTSLQSLGHLHQGSLWLCWYSKMCSKQAMQDKQIQLTGHWKRDRFNSEQ